MTAMRANSALEPARKDRAGMAIKPHAANRGGSSAHDIHLTEIEITREMIAAGVDAYGYYERLDQVERAVKRIYEAMFRISKKTFQSSDTEEEL
jgi:hypothetical protein